MSQVEVENPLTVGTPNALTPRPCTLVIFGAAGDLSWRKLIPAIYNLNADGVLPSNFAVVGFGIGSQGDPDEWIRARAKDGIQRFSRQPLERGRLERPRACPLLCRGELQRPPCLRASQDEARRGRADVRHPGEPGLLPLDPAGDGPRGGRTPQDGRDDPAPADDPLVFSRVIVEKPIGRDLESARKGSSPPSRTRSRSRRRTGSTTTSARRRSRTCWSSGSRTASSSRSGTRSTSTTSRSRWRRRTA